VPRPPRSVRGASLTKAVRSIDTLAAQWIPAFHLYQSGPCRFPSIGDAGLTVAGCSF
jgi:hypothetical protein